MTTPPETLQAELAQLKAERDAGLKREAALAQITRRINQHPLDFSGNLLAIAEAARDLTDSDGSRVCLVEGDEVVGYQMSTRVPELKALYDARYMGRVSLEDAQQIHAATIRLGHTLNLDDGYAHAQTLGVSREGFLANLRSMMATPIKREGVGLGSLYTVRITVRPYTQSEIATLEAFADQAAVAIETARMFRELQARNHEVTEALRREEAGSEILRQISQAPEDLDATLQAITAAAQRLTGMTSALTLIEDGRVVNRGIAVIAGDEIHDAVGQSRSIAAYYQLVMRERVLVSWNQDAGINVEVAPELLAEIEADAQRFGVRATATAPIKRGDEIIGFLNIANSAGTPIAATVISLLESFADQASIAIENARLIRELRESDALKREALDVQGVMARVLGVIAGAPSDLRASFPEIASAAKQLTNADISAVVVNDGDRILAFSSVFGDPFADTNHDVAHWLLPENRAFGTVAMFENRVVEIAGPVVAWADKYPRSANLARAAGGTEGTYLAVPLPGSAGSQGAAGSIMVGRGGLAPFSEDHRRILSTLASQAMIAIQNARLFGELQKRNAEITEALRREEAGSAILRQISESPEQLEETLQAITEACLALTGCSSKIWTFEGDESVLYGAASAAHDERKVLPKGTRVPISKEGRLALENKAPAIYQLAAGVSETFDGTLSATGSTRIKSAAFVPVIRAKEVTAMLTLVDCDESVLPLVQSFADQAARATAW
jgi:two-component system, NtrC family, sensor kinase